MMSRLLITGSNGYIGKSFISWLSSNVTTNDIIADELSVRGESWKNHDFSIYDSVLHLAGIAHVSKDNSLKEKYYEVNTNLAMQVATQAKLQGAKRFILMSSMIVYGKPKFGKINTNTIPEPKDVYGDSKLKAEEGIKLLEDSNFQVVIIRPPMIYGKNSKGNYNKLAYASKKLPIFPNYQNKRSMLYIENLCIFLYHIIKSDKSGTFFPQNKEYICTSRMVKEISNVHKHKIVLLPGFNLIINMCLNLNVINKVFGDFYYHQDMSEYDFDYAKYSLSDSIKLTEATDEKSVNSF